MSDHIKLSDVRSA